MIARRPDNRVLVLSADRQLRAAIKRLDIKILDIKRLDQSFGFAVSLFEVADDAERSIRTSANTHSPFSVMFLDAESTTHRETLAIMRRVWSAAPLTQIVLCDSKFEQNALFDDIMSDHRWIFQRKPCSPDEIERLTISLAAKWRATRQTVSQLRELDRFVDERTSELQTAMTELESARSAAEAANRSKTEFLANVSHEIRTPMTAILGYTDLLIEKCRGRSVLEELHIIKRNGEGSLHIVNDILDLSRIEAEKIEIESVDCSPFQVVADVESLMRVQAEMKQVRLNAEFLGAVPNKIKSDPIRLRQILINLVGNAIKFTPQGSVRIVTKFSKADSALQISVIDTGIGMTPERAKKMFRPFVQADTSTTREYGGTGLGLSISLRLARIMGGDIRYHRPKNGGSMFRLAIPVELAEQAQVVHPSVADTTMIRIPSVIAESETDGEHIIGRVLLVEDSIDSQHLLAHFLRAAGIDVAVASNGQQAVDETMMAWKSGNAFDLILMDMQMPILDGYQATAKLRELGYHRTIVALTAHAMSQDRQACIEAGCDDHLTKPITRERLISAVRSYLPRTVNA